MTRLDPDPDTDPYPDSEIVETIFALLGRRSGDATICPSEVARAMHSKESDWRASMPRVREAAGALAARGLLRVTRNGEEVDATSQGGPIRLGRAAGVGRKP